MTVKYNYKTILATAALLLVAIAIAFLFENYYRQFVRFSFKFFNGDSIQFVGKNFHLFPSIFFIIAFELFTSLTFLLLKFSLPSARLKRICVTVFVFFATIISITALDSNRLVVECTACHGGVRKLTFNEPAYDTYFVISLAAAFAYLLMVYLLKRNRLRKTS